MSVDKKPEDRMHLHEWVRLFHEKLLHIIDHWHTNDVIPEVRERVRDVIQEIGPEMYQPYAVRDWTSIRNSFEKKNWLYIPKDYEW